MEPVLIEQTQRWLILDKPAGWLTIPGRTAEGAKPLPVLSDWLKSRFGEIFTVHRLDRDTSGLVLFARDAASHRQAGIWFQNHEVKKSYDCLAQGSPALPVFRVDEPVEGQASRTQFEVKRKLRDSVFLARALPQSGRRHQIRKHLAFKGHPILGDITYGGAVAMGGIQIARVALHAAGLELPGGERFEAPWPPDFASWVEKLS